MPTVFDHIRELGHDEDFDPEGAATYDDLNTTFLPTDAPAGSEEKIEVLRRRALHGQPLWHKDDRLDYSGLTGAIRAIKQL